MSLHLALPVTTPKSTISGPCMHIRVTKCVVSIEHLIRPGLQFGQRDRHGQYILKHVRFFVLKEMQANLCIQVLSDRFFLKVRKKDEKVENICIVLSKVKKYDVKCTYY